MTEEKKPRRGRRPKQVPVEETFRLCVENNRQHHAYVRLFDPGWQKDGLQITPGEMEDPTRNYRPDWQDYVAKHLDNDPETGLRATQVWIWSPAIPAFLELYTLHIYEDTGEETFGNLRVLLATLEPEQANKDIIFWDHEFTFTDRTRMALIVPAFNKMVIDITYTYTPDN